MAPRPYRLLPHTADLRVSVSAPDFPALCARCAEALSSLATDRRCVRPRRERRVAVPPGDASEGLHAFLRSVLLLLCAERFLVRAAAAEPPSRPGEGWSVLLRGEEAEPRRHRFPRELKAVTRHAFSAAPAPGGGWRASFVLDV